MAVAEKAIVTDALKSLRQDMNQKSPNELVGRQGHGLLPVIVTVILPMKRDPILFNVE